MFGKLINAADKRQNVSPLEARSDLIFLCLLSQAIYFAFLIFNFEFERKRIWH